MTPAGVVSTYVDSSKGLNTPDGLTFDSAGNLYIANFHGETISKVTPGGTVTTFADVNSPNSPVFGPNGDLYVCDKYDGTIVEITPAGVVSTFVDNTHGLSYPIALAFDDSGNLYVDSQNNSTIYKVTAAGSVSVFASGGLINSPTDMVFGPGGNLYVYNSGTSAITEVTPAGVVSNFLTLDSAVAGTYAGLVFDSAGDLYVINNGNSTISKIAPPTLVEGQPVTNQTVFQFTDANPDGTASQYTAVVTLGDGNTVTLSSSGVVGNAPAGAGGQIVADPGGGFDVELSYTYAEAFSNQTFGVQVTDEGGATTGASTNNFSVANVVLTVTPVAGQSHVYGTPLPILGYTISGFVNGDTKAIVRGVLGTTATASSPVGKYAFTLGTLSAGSKYTLQLAANSPNFAVTPDTLTISLENSATTTEGQPLITMGSLVSSTTASADGRLRRRWRSAASHAGSQRYFLSGPRLSIGRIVHDHGESRRLHRTDRNIADRRDSHQRGSNGTDRGCSCQVSQKGSGDLQGSRYRSWPGRRPPIHLDSHDSRQSNQEE